MCRVTQARTHTRSRNPEGLQRATMEKCQCKQGKLCTVRKHRESPTGECPCTPTSKRNGKGKKYEYNLCNGCLEYKVQLKKGKPRNEIEVENDTKQVIKNARKRAKREEKKMEKEAATQQDADMVVQLEEEIAEREVEKALLDAVVQKLKDNAEASNQERDKDREEAEEALQTTKAALAKALEDGLTSQASTTAAVRNSYLHPTFVTPHGAKFISNRVPFGPLLMMFVTPFRLVWESSEN